MADSGVLHITPKWGKSKLEYKLRKLCNDRENLREVHRIFAEECESFVPIDTGTLRQSVFVSYKEVRWSAYGEDGRNYAHYVYEGQVYGPNYWVPIERIEHDDTYDYDENGEWGWRSPKGQPKYPTGKKMKYQNPKASSHWDKVMLERRGRLFKNRVERYLKGRLKNG